MFDLNRAKYEEGRHAYTHGVTVLAIAEAVEHEHKAAGEQNADWRTHQNAAQSLMLGFVEGVVADIRKIAGSARGGMRA